MVFQIYIFQYKCLLDTKNYFACKAPDYINVKDFLNHYLNKFITYKMYICLNFLKFFSVDVICA